MGSKNTGKIGSDGLVRCRGLEAKTRAEFNLLPACFSLCIYLCFKFLFCSIYIFFKDLLCYRF